MITICIPVLRRYDYLAKLFVSAESGELPPDKYIIFDNGGLFYKMPLPTGLNDKIEVITPGRNVGVARAWNEMIRHSTDIRIISNDDVEFRADTIKIFAETFDENMLSLCANSFSCFCISTKLFNTIGEFDVNLSPNYAYYEDNDYRIRIKLYGQGFGFKDPGCGYEHINSATLKSFSNEEMSDHHRRFEFAKGRYVRKWGGLPYEETYTTEYNK